MKNQAIQEKHAMNEFNLEEAVSLIYRHVVLKNNAIKTAKVHDITQIGHVCGVLTLNDQIEVVVKFLDELKQYTKEEFNNEVKLIDRQ